MMTTHNIGSRRTRGGAHFAPALGGGSGANRSATAGRVNITLLTDRLCLRPPEDRDFDRFAHFYASDRASARGWHRDRNAASQLFSEILAYWKSHGIGWFVLEKQISNTTIGMVGVWQPKGQPEPSLDWTIWHGCDEGQGLAFEAAQAARNFAFKSKKVSTLVGYIHPENYRSISLAKRLGAYTDGRWLSPSGKNLTIYRHPKPEAH